jgi:hypothetical protein
MFGTLAFLAVLMRRWIQGLLLGAGLIVVSVLLIAFALAWGPHERVCKIAFPMVIGCAIGTYQALASGLIAASSALFAGWLAWSAVRAHTNAEADRAMADRTEAERVLRGEIDDLAGGLGVVWKILDGLNESSNANETGSKLKVATFGIDRITEPVRLTRLRDMTRVLGRERWRVYEDIFDRLERLGRTRNVDDFDVYPALVAVRDLGNALFLAQPETGEHFGDLIPRSIEATTLAEVINRQAEILDDDKALPSDRIAVAIQTAKAGSLAS